MAAPIPRIGILPKYVTVLTVALLTAAANLHHDDHHRGQRPDRRFRGIGASAGMFTAAFGLLLFATFSRPFSWSSPAPPAVSGGSQAYLIPLMLVSLAAGMLGLMPDVELSESCW
jgi:hypothetical protein